MTNRGQTRGPLRQLVLVGLALCAWPALAEDPKARAAREELERQLHQMVGKAPTKVKIELEALDEPNYVLEDASFELDGRTLGSPPLSRLNAEGTHLVWHGDVQPGKHVVAVRLVYGNGTSIVVSDEGGYKWKVGGDVSFELHQGIEVQVKVTPQRDSKQPDIARRFRLSLPAKPVMLATVDDGSMPEPPPKPVIAEAVVDAGTPGPSAAELAAAEKKAKAEAAAEAKRLADEEKKAKALAAAEAKREAAAAKKAKLEAAREAKRLAAEEKKRKAQEAAEAKKLAAEEKKRLALEAAEAKRLAAEGKLPPVDTGTGPVAAAVDAGAPEVVDAGPAVVAELVDAGAPVVVAVAPPPTPAPQAEEGGGLPWPILGGAAGGALVVVLILLARRRSRPPTLDD